MNAHSTRPALALSFLLAVLWPTISGAASPAEEARFVAAVRKAFDEHKGLTELVCWDRVGDAERKSTEKMYKELVEEKDVVWEFKLVDPDPKAVERSRKEENGIVRKGNLAVIKQLKMTFRDKDGKRILEIIGVGVGEKDGKLMLAAVAMVE